jgi:flavin-dependent dehydrogenase
MRVAIIGGGPAGAFCAIQIIKMSGRGSPEITIYDRKTFSRPGPSGCNLGAGVIARSMIDTFEREHIPIPPAVIQNKITGFSFFVEGGERHFELREEKTFYAVFRGGGPLCTPGQKEESFDRAVLSHAESLGARSVEMNIADIAFPTTAGGPFQLIAADGSAHPADVVVGAFGVNSALGKKLSKKGIGYRPPKTITVCQTEVPLPENAIRECFAGKIKVLSCRLSGIRFVALTPKRDYVTVTVIGKDATKHVLEQVMSDERVSRHFPRGLSLERNCFCQPKLPVSPAKNPYGERFVVIGDANVSRFYKNGIGSAFLTATYAAENIAAGRVGRQDFRRHYYRKCADTYHRDNLFGKVLFLLNDVISKSRYLSSVHLQVAEDAISRSLPIGVLMDELLVDLFTGETPYAAIFRKTLDPGLQLALTKKFFSNLRGVFHG